ncbi:mitochondrial import receptor subunit TOM40B isoform X2 [Meriones unguiculatus]|uniref:mitochondrial import receptor subunit TOM40B isoform X2 n=1 Tax=Meriones unguiculatus TaxID=10047 RepID=UPI00293E7EA1|nr:mitochondrial import receptor subunit TOM40B isoform X2 [Meriones unguiculatus]
MLMSSDVNRKGRSRLEHPALRKDQRFRVEHFVAGLERRSVPPGLPRGLKGEPISLARGPYFCLFLPFSSLPPDVFPAQMEGVKLVVNKVLSSHFQVSHTVHMSALGLPGYHLHAAYAGDWQLSPTEVFPTVVGDMDSSGSLNAQVLLLLAERLRAKAVFQTQQAKFLTWQFDGEYRGDDYTATLTLGNPDLIGESVIMVAHFLQSITHRLVLGGELVYHRRPGEEGAILTLAGKYSAVHWVATLNVGSGGAHASYYHKANEQVQVGVEFEANTRLQDTTFSFGYHLTLPQADMVFRGLVDSNWCVGAVLEKKMRPLPVTLALGAFLNHWRNRFHCGFSITVG